MGGWRRGRRAEAWEGLVGGGGGNGEGASGDHEMWQSMFSSRRLFVMLSQALPASTTAAAATLAGSRAQCHIHWPFTVRPAAGRVAWESFNPDGETHLV